MLAAAPLVAALVAAPPGSERLEPGPAHEPSERRYEGPAALDSPPEPALPAGPEPAATVVPKPTPLIAEPTTRRQTAPAEPSTTPRVLSTISGLPKTEQASFGNKVIFYPGVQVRNQVGWVSAFTLDRIDNEYDDAGFSTGRIRWTPRLSVHDKLEVVGGLDVLNGRWAPARSDNDIIEDIVDGGTPPTRATLRRVDARELYLTYRFGFGYVQLGQQAFTWGQGILANDGNHNDRFGDIRFGDDGPGDLYERVLIGIQPFERRTGPARDISIALGGDLVFRDEAADLTDGDLAGQFVFMVNYAPRHRPANTLGMYVFYREQRNNDDDDAYPNDNELKTGTIDIAGQGTLPLSGPLQLVGAFEAALTFGRTKLLRNDTGTHQVVAGGVVARGYVGRPERWLVGLDAGYASGDSNPSDNRQTDFLFDDGHNVGLILFDAIQGWRTARSQRLVDDPALAGAPFNGSELIPTQGRATNALYFHPKARYALWERLEVWGGPLFVVAPNQIADPYATFVNGGQATNSIGGDADRRYYGTELDVGVRGRFDIRKLWLQAGVQGGLLIPGPGLANEDGNADKAIGAVWFRTELRY